MAVELEIKLKVDDHAAVVERLREAGARHVSDVLEINRFFDAPDGGLRTADRGLRIRTNRNLASDQVQHVLTYKGPRQPGPMKRREEIEFAVNEVDAAAAFLSAMGYQKVRSFEKRRSTWTLGECEVVLDVVPYLGAFVEIEGASIGEIERIQRDLGLSDAVCIKESYIALLTKHSDENEIRELDIRFPDSNTTASEP
jgi:adenylate cyclase, class 2